MAEGESQIGFAIVQSAVWSEMSSRDTADRDVDQSLPPSILTLTGTDPYSASLDLLRRLPPTKVEANLAVICALQPDLADDLLSAVDQPLKVERDGETGKEYLCCDFNKDGESYRYVPRSPPLFLPMFYKDDVGDAYVLHNPDRSPWSNTWTPPVSDAPTPSPKLRELEVAMNNAFDTYREM